jgi:hypothetical protein
MNARAAALALCLAMMPAQAVETLAGFAPSRLQPGGALPPDWRPIASPKIPRHTRYSLVADEGATVLRAESEQSMSSLARSIDIDPARHPRLRWRWKVENLVSGSDMYSKRGDDFPVRVYVFFDVDIGGLPFSQRLKIRLARALYGSDVPLGALCYVWATRHPAGASTWNAYTDRVRMIVAQSGERFVGTWVTIERNVADDYRLAFGAEPPRITGVAVATDTDNTGERAVAYYGDIEFLEVQAGR